MLDLTSLNSISFYVSGRSRSRLISLVTGLSCVLAYFFFILSSSISAKVTTSVLSQDDNALSVRVQFDSLFQHIEIANAVSGGKSAIYPVLLNIPADVQDVRVSAAVNDPVGVLSDDFAGREVSTTIPAAYLDEIFEVRGARMARVVVSPFQNGLWYRSVDVSLNFSQRERADVALSSESEGPIAERLFQAMSPNAGAYPARAKKSERLSSASAPHPFDLNQVWTKISIANSSSALETDLYRVTGAQLAQAGYTLPILSNQIRIFYAGGLPIEVDNSRPRPDFRELSIKIVDGGDGQFGSTDYLLFVGEKVDRWVYRTGFGPRFYNNIYTNDNCYWLGVSVNFSGSPLRFGLQSIAPSITADTTFTWLTARVRAEQDNLISEDINGHIEDYYNWHWTDAATLQVSLATPGRVPGDTGSLLLIGKTNNCCGPVSYMNASMNGVTAFSKNCNRFNCSFRTTSLVDGANNLSLSFGRQLTSIPSFFDYAELTYKRQLRPDNNQLDMLFPQSSRVARVEIADQFASTPILIDITDSYQPRELTGAVRSGGLVSADIALSDSVQRRVLVTVDSRIQSPASLQRLTINNLRAQRPQADLLLIAPRAFLGAMQEYVSYRQADGYSITTVPVEEIMENFAFGLYDPMAVRDYLKFAYQNFASPAPSAALFVGDGNFDFLDRLGTGQHNQVPVAIQGRSQSYGDDNYVYFGDYGLLVGDTASYVVGQGPDMVVGRWPVKSTAEIRTIIGKIKRYESNTTAGDWRNRIALIADDQFSGGSTNETFHAVQTEQLDRQFIPAPFERRKIYMWEYPFANREKPSCNDDIVEAFNDGALIVNYVGHGNPDVWAHERTLKRTVDLPRLTNRNQLPLVFAASCAIGFYDDPNRQGMGEDFLTMSNGGAIGVIAASRLVYAFDNSEFNKKSYEIIFEHPELTIAEQFFLSKLERQYRNGRFIAITNDQQYIYFGDPLLKLRQPTNRATVILAPTELTALARMTVSGQLTDTSGVPLSGNGEVSVALLDADRARVFKLLADNGTVLQQVTYLVNGPSLFRGSAPVENGNYSISFVPPADLSFGENAARVVTYATVGSTQAVGLLDSIVIADTVATNSDSTGPIITYAIAGREQFAAGDPVLATDTLVISVADSLGINLSGSVGHTLDLSIDGDEFQRRNLTREFSYLSGSFTTGTVRVPLADLAEGSHTISFRAWDNANNPTEQVTRLTVVSPGAVATSEMLPYPNPMQEQTTFYFTLTSPVELLDLEIYTLSGRKIRTYRASNLGADSYPNSQLSLSWDGRDYSGDPVASGVYLFRTVTTAASGQGDEQFGKIIVVKQ